MEKIFAIIQIIFVALFLLNIGNIVKSIKEKNEEELIKDACISLVLVMIGVASYFLGK